MKNILITGGAGFIGSNLAEALKKRGGYDIHILDVKKHPKNIENMIEYVNYMIVDVRDKKAIYNILRQMDFDGVIHLAAISRVIWGEQQPELCISINRDGTKTLLDVISKLNKKPWFIFGSSREVYGEPKKLPVKEEDPKMPINVYGKAKLDAERTVCTYAKNFGINALVMRFSNVYGDERDILDRVIPRFILRAMQGNYLELHGGYQIFDFTYIYDTINAIMRGIDYLDDINNKGKGICEDIHVLTGKPTRLVDLPGIISKYMDYEVDVKFTKPRSYDVNTFYGDPTKAEDMLGFRAKVNIDEGIKRTIRRFREVFK